VKDVRFLLDDGRVIKTISISWHGALVPLFWVSDRLSLI